VVYLKEIVRYVHKLNMNNVPLTQWDFTELKVGFYTYIRALPSITFGNCVFAIYVV
jgi:hypothetical protein